MLFAFLSASPIAILKEEPPFATPAGIIAIGAGVLVGSIAFVALSFCGCCKGRKE